MTLGLEPTSGRGPGLRTGTLLIATIVLLVVQSVVAHRLPIRLDMATLVIVFLALETAFWPGLWTSLIVGYLAGLHSGIPAGVDASVAVIEYIVIRIFVARVVGSRWLLVTTIAAAATAGAVLAQMFILSMLGSSARTWLLVFPTLPARVIASALLAWPVFRVLQWVRMLLTPRDER